MPMYYDDNGYIPNQSKYAAKRSNLDNDCAVASLNFNDFFAQLFLCLTQLLQAYM